MARANDGETITVFEILTAVGFVLFSEHEADAALIEVGLGGRFDATNVIDHPAASLIMPISLDHQSYLGDRVELIAAEKAGIIKPGIPVVVGFQQEETARDVVVATADRLGCPVSVYGQDYHAHEEHGRLVYQDETGLADLPLPNLPGRHQLANAAAAIRVLKAAGFDLANRDIETGLQRVEWPGRMQRLTAGRIFESAPSGAEIWIDGGHNPGAGPGHCRNAGRTRGTGLATAVPGVRHDQHQGSGRLFRRFRRHGAACLHGSGRQFRCRGRPRGARRRSLQGRPVGAAGARCLPGAAAHAGRLGGNGQSAAHPDLRLALPGRRRAGAERCHRYRRRRLTGSGPSKTAYGPNVALKIFVELGAAYLISWIYERNQR